MGDAATAQPAELVDDSDDAADESQTRQNTPRSRPSTLWKPGQSGNPGGRPATLAGMRSALERVGGHALYRKQLLRLVRGGEAIPASVQMSAVTELGNRLYGKAEQAVHVTGDDGARLPTLDSAGLKRLLTAIAALEADEAAIDVTPDSPAVAPDAEKP